MDDGYIGTVAYCYPEGHVEPGFTACLARLCAAMPGLFLNPVRGNDVVAGRNSAIREMKGDWIWFIDTDMEFDTDVILRLLDCQVPVVQALCLSRHPPHGAILFTTGTTRKRDEAPVGPPRVVRVKRVGPGGTLFMRSALMKIQDPWFEGAYPEEDIALSDKLVAAGITLHCDLSTPVGHITPVSVWPNYVDGKWCLRYFMANGVSINLPLLVQEPLVRL